jgi:predicted nucleic acid-binding protein
VILVDTNVLLDVLQDDPIWAGWSQDQLEAAQLTDVLIINPVIYSELSIAFERIEELEAAVREARLTLEEIPREALFLAGKAFLDYRRRQGRKHGVPPDFYIGAHAAVRTYAILTRDTGRYRSYYPSVRLITPAQSRA